MAKVIVNGKEATPAKKVKLDQHVSRVEIQKLIKQKREELQSGQQPSGNQG